MSVKADVCTAPQLLGLLRRRDHHALGAAQRDSLGRPAPARPWHPRADDLLACPSEDELEDWLSDDTEVSAILGIPHQLLVAYRVPRPGTCRAAGR